MTQFAIRRVPEEPPERGFVPRIVESPAPAFDIDKFSATLTALEHYVDVLLAFDDPPPMDPWLDDDEVELRLLSI